MKHILAILFLALIAHISFAQNYSIKVIDSETNEAIEYAHIQFENCTDSSNFLLITNQNGVATNQLKTICKARISFIGYQTQSLDILPYQNKTIKLEKYAFDLGEIVVTAHFTRMLKKDAIYEINTLKKSRLETNGTSNLGEILQLQPNIQINNGQANESALMLNGLSGAYVKILIDGVPVEGKLRGSVDLSQITNSNIEKIEILEGPASIEYGSDALAGAINIITKKNQHKKMSVGVDAFYESVGKYNISANLGLKFKTHFVYINAGRHFFDGYSLKDTSRYKEWKPKEEYFAEASYSKKIKHLKLFYNFKYYNQLITSRGAPRAPYYISAFDTYYRTNRITNMFILDGKLVKHHFINASISHSYYHRKRNIYFKDLTTLENKLSSNKNDQDTTVYNNFLTRVVYNLKPKKSIVHFMAGTQLKYDQINANRVKNRKQSLFDLSVFSHAQIKLFDKLSIQPALRYGYNTKYKYPLLPSLSLKYDVNKNLSLRSSYSRGFRAPSLKELYLEFHFNSTINLYGSDNLKAENSHHFLLSADYKLKKKAHEFRLRPKFFYNNINQMISLVNISKIDWQYSNIGNYDVLGFALNTSYKFKNIALTFDYQLLGQKNSIYQDIDYKDHFHLSHQFGTNLDINIPKYDVSIHTNYKYNGKRTGIYLDNNNEAKQSSLAHYQILNMSVNKRFFKDHFSLTLGVKNILNYNQIDLDGDLFGLSASKDADNLKVLWGRTFFSSLQFKW